MSWWNLGLKAKPFIFSRLGSCLQWPCTFPCTIYDPTVTDYSSLPRTHSAARATCPSLCGLPVRTFPACRRRGSTRLRAARRGRPRHAAGHRHRGAELLVCRQIDRRRTSRAMRWRAGNGGVAVSALHRTGLRRLLARAEGLGASGVPICQLARTRPSRSASLMGASREQPMIG